MALFNDEELHIDHKEPKWTGGTNAYSNLTLLHLYCHQQKTSGEAQQRASARHEHLTL